MARQQVTLDPAVEAVLGEGRQRRQRRGMTVGQRKKAEQDARRKRVTLELKPQVVEMVRLIAEFEECSPAGIVDLFVAEAGQRYIEGEIILNGRRRASRSPRWGWVIVLDGLDDLVASLRQFLNRGEG